MICYLLNLGDKANNSLNAKNAPKWTLSKKSYFNKEKIFKTIIQILIYAKPCKVNKHKAKYLLIEQYY